MFVGRPGDGIDTGGVERMFLDALPSASDDLLLPDEDPAVEGAGGEDGAKFRMGPGDGPDGTIVSSEDLTRTCGGRVEGHMRRRGWGGGTTSCSDI